MRANSPFYAAHLAHGPASLATFADVEKLPFTTQEDIRQHAMDMLCVPQDHVARAVRSHEFRHHRPSQTSLLL